jgi:nitrogen-specific signal transduction histidine kinase/CheY-like chemotaxis protein
MRPIKDRKGRVIKLFGTVQDVTERKLLEQQVLNSEKLAAIGELAAGVAHEINNPLQGVTGYAQLLDDRKDLPDDVRDDLHRIYNESQRAVRIVQNLLRFASQQKPAKTALDINEVIKGALELRAYELRTEDIKVSLQLEPGLPWVVADYGQMQQVIINIVTNAEQALFSMKRKGNITIKTEKANNVVRISIADNGPGIPAEYLDRVFDPFFTTKEVGSGSGLGLSMCHGIVTEHGGTILAQSQAGQGATFIIELPLVAEEQGEEQAEIVEERTPRRSKKASGTILIVDDEESIRNILTRVLSQEGYQADTAVSGKAALKKLAQRAYDLLILDFKMPDMGGRELYGNLKVKYPEMADKVLFSTGDTMTGETHTFITSTGRPFLSKPFNHQELLKLVEETIG